MTIGFRIRNNTRKVSPETVEKFRLILLAPAVCHRVARTVSILVSCGR